MKIIFKIARAEFRNLFYSPVAWVVLVVFFVICGIQFVTPMMDYARVQELQIANNPKWIGFTGPLTFVMFVASIKQMLSYLYLFIPLLTMGSINREINTGTMKLLSSSPVGIREIVLGKYLGLTFFNLALLSSIAFLLFTGYASIQHAEFIWYCTMLLGFFLLSAVYMAIGLFISSLTSYQIVAGIATFIVFFLLGQVGGMMQEYDFIRDLTWFLSLSGRTENLIAGLITTRDIFYFILVIILFLGMTIIRLKSKQESKRWTVSFCRYLLLIVIVLMTGYFSGRPGYVGYLDVTRDKLNTIDTATQAVLKELDGSPITVTLYTNLLNRGVQEGHPAARNAYVWNFWEKYYRFYPNIRLKYEYYYDIKPGDSLIYKSAPKKTVHQIAAQFSRLFQVDLDDFKKPGEIDSTIDMSREDMWRLIMQLEYKGKKSFLRTFDSPVFPDQPNVSAGIRKLSRDDFPGIFFTTGHYERSPWRNGEREYGPHTNEQAMRRGMINLGMLADTVSLQHQSIPASAEVLVVADPRSALDSTEQGKINRFIEGGGNMLFYGEPGKQQMLNPILNRIGIHLESGRLVMPQLHRASDIFLVGYNKKVLTMARERGFQIAQMTGTDPGTFFSGTCYISHSDTMGFKVEPIIEFPGKEGLWLENGLYTPDSAKPVFSAEEGDLKKAAYVLGVRLTRKLNNKEQRIVVMSDADFMTSMYQNGSDTGLGLYSWLSYNKYPVYITEIMHKDIRVAIGKLPAKMLWYVYTYILPGLLLLTGIIILMRRRRK